MLDLRLLLLLLVLGLLVLLVLLVLPGLLSPLLAVLLLMDQDAQAPAALRDA